MVVENPDIRFQFSEIARVVAENFGSTSAQSLARAKKFVNRAADRIVLPGRDKWSWLYGTDFLDTIADTEVYSLPESVKKPHIFYMTGSFRQKLKRIPTRTFRDWVPDTSDTTGKPSMYDFVGRDSSGAIQVRLWPIPDTEYRIYVDFKKNIEHMRQDQDDAREFFSLPPDMLEILIQMATALSFKGIDDARYTEDMAEAEFMLANAYADDQENNDTVIRAREIETEETIIDGPIYPSNIG